MIKWLGRYLSGSDGLASTLRAVAEKVFTGGAVGIELHFQLGRSYNEKGDEKRAFEHYTRAREISEKQYGEDHTCTATTMESVALIYVKRRKFADAEALFKRVLEIRRAHNVPQPQISISMQNLAICYANQNKFHDAALLYSDALSRIDEHNNPRDYVRILLNRGILLAQYDRDDQAEQVWKRALPLAEEKLGANDKLTTQILRCLSGLCYRQKRDDEAQRYADKFVSAFKKSDAETNDFDQLMSACGSLMTVQQDYESAEPLLRRACKIAEEQQNYPKAMQAALMLAKTFEKQKKFSDQTDVCERAAEYSKQVELDNDSVASTVFAFGCSMLLRQRYAAATPLIQSALKFMEDHNEPDKIRIAIAYSALGQGERGLGEFDAAIEHYKRAIDIYDGISDLPKSKYLMYREGLSDGERTPQHRFKVLRCEPYIGLAETHRLNGNAEKMSESCELLKTLAESGEPIPEPFINVGFLLSKLDRYDESSEYYNRALPLINATPEKMRLRSIALGNLCYNYIRQGKLDEAETLIKEVREIRERELAPDDLLIAELHANFARLAAARNRHEEAEKEFELALSLMEAKLFKSHMNIIEVAKEFAESLRKEGKVDYAERIEKKFDLVITAS